MVRRILLPALLVWCAGTGWGLDSSRRLTQYVHRIWTTQQGLPSGTIYDIWQTRDSFLWLGTQTGLVRFDGVRFTAGETLYPGLPENLWVRSGFEEADGASGWALMTRVSTASKTARSRIFPPRTACLRTRFTA